jgi:hypothetical protein
MSTSWVAHRFHTALKSEALAWRFTGDPTDMQNTFDRIDMVYKYHGRASGRWMCLLLIVSYTWFLCIRYILGWWAHCWTWSLARNGTLRRRVRLLQSKFIRPADKIFREQIFSLATIYQIFGNNSLADHAEKLGKWKLRFVCKSFYKTLV